MYDEKDVHTRVKLIEDIDGNKGIPPVYATDGSACADVACPCDVKIPPHKSYLIDLLLQLDIPSGFKVIMYPRSSLMIKKGLMSPTSIIDPDYKDNIHVPLFNMTDSPVIIKKGERIAQIESVPRYHTVDWFQNNAKRYGGFGSTGER